MNSVKLIAVSLLVILLSACSEYIPGPDASARLLDTPQNLVAGDGDFDDRIVAEWDAVETALTYNVYRSEFPDSGYQVIASTDTPSYEDTRVTCGRLYYYRVEANNASSISGLSKVDSGYCGTLP